MNSLHAGCRGVLSRERESPLTRIPGLAIITLAGEFIEPCTAFVDDSAAHVELERESTCGRVCVANFDDLHHGSHFCGKENSGPKCQSAEICFPDHARRA